MPPLNIFSRAPVLSNNVCNTTACIAASEYILAHVNLTVDPCTDFYQYTCGSWVNSPPVKENYEKGILTREFDLFDLENTQRQMQILEGTYEDFKQNIKSNTTGFHLDTQAELDKSNFEFYQSYYNVCKDVSLYQNNRFAPIFEDIVMLQKNFTTSMPSATQISHLMAFLTLQDITLTPFQISVSLSYQDHNKREVYLASSRTLRRYTYNRETIVSRLFQVVGQPETNDPDTQKAIEASQRSGLELWSNNTISEAVDNHERIVSFIRENYNSTASEFDFSVDAIMDKPTLSFDAVQKALPKVDISALLMELSEGLEASAMPELHFRTSLTFLENVNTLFSTESEKAIQDFFIVQYIVEKYTHLAPTFLSELSSNATSEQRNATIASVQQACSVDTNQHFAAGLSRYFGLETFGDDSDRQKTLEFVEVFRESLLDRIASNTWLDEETKQAAINKMKQVKADVGYRVSDPDWRDPTSMKEYYGNRTIDTRSYYHAKKDALYDYNKRMWKNISAEYEYTVWDLISSSGTLNAAYMRNSNSIGILLGILRKPMYSTDFPEYLNFGNLGAIISHEFVHGLDNVGKRLNGTGHLHDWWTPQATKEYEERQQCFIDEYSAVSITDEEGNDVYIDGENTLGENIADIGGLSTAVDAYRKYINKERQGQPEPSLPSLEHLTAEQMLYVSFGLFHCESIPPNHANYYAIDPHAPFFARTNPVVRNNEDFAAAFNCPADSPMNKKEKCHLW
ncbi:hypothetical protein BD560DRAFT_360723 [Blakeslea trispora]|nr:hypothetical protein BD560DRAFT_360723 [Blakeslea trispora]